MAEFFINNGSTIVIGVILLAIVTAVIRKMLKDRREGKTCGSCSGCSGCAGTSRCGK